MTILFTNLQKAIDDLQESWDISCSPVASDEKLFRQFRKSCIQSFEFTFEEALKSIKRTLVDGGWVTRKDMSNASVKEALDYATKHGLISEKWETYRQLRDLSSHNYRPQSAEDIYRHIPDFLKD